MSSFKRFYLFTCFYFIANLCPAQNQTDLEIGITAGSVFYISEVNRYSKRNPGPAAGTFLRWNIHSRLAAKTHLQYAGSYSFEPHFLDVGIHLEYYFFPYNTSGRKYIPYLLGGMGVTLSPPEHNRLTALNVPFGMGLKYKINDRFNLGLEISFKKFFTAWNKEVGKWSAIRNGLLKNRDCITLLNITISRNINIRRQNCNIVYY